MRRFLAALIVSLGFADPAGACTTLWIPKPDDLRRADVVAQVVLQRAEPGPNAKYLNYIFPSALLTFETARTYKGVHQELWRVIWRRGDAKSIGAGEVTGREDNRPPYFGPDGRYYYFQRFGLRIGGSLIVGIVSPENQFFGRGCQDSGRHECFPNCVGGYHFELLAHPCGPGFAHAFTLSDILEDRVLKVLAEEP